VLVARSTDKLKEVAANISKSYPNVETLLVPTDIADPGSVKSLFEKVKEKYGHADVLINNAGIFKAIAPVSAVDQQMWWEEMASVASPPCPPQLTYATRPSTFAAHFLLLKIFSRLFLLQRRPPKS
jgi:NAD(P)-dependent dehydrogenase (short-subunit alcohol dehydrogenase family)